MKKRVIVMKNKVLVELYVPTIDEIYNLYLLFTNNTLQK